MSRLQDWTGDKFRWRLHPAAATVLAGTLLLLGGIGLFRVAMSSYGQAPDTDTAIEKLEAPSPSNSMSGLEPLGYALQDSMDAGAEQADGGSVPSHVVVHVTGAVNNPGVVDLREGQRVVDAVEGAGGVTEEADLASVNLAAVVSDGDHIHVAKEGDTTAAPVLQGAAPSAGVHSATPDGGSGANSGCVDLNVADVAALQALDGVGPKLAQRIIDYRDSNGPFSSVTDLTQVSGIGPVLVQRISAGACQ